MNTHDKLQLRFLLIVFVSACVLCQHHTVYAFPRIVGTEIHLLDFGAASYGKSSTNEVEKDKISVLPKTICPSFENNRHNLPILPYYHHISVHQAYDIISYGHQEESVPEVFENHLSEVRLDSSSCRLLSTILLNNRELELIFSAEVDSVFAVIPDLYKVNKVPVISVNWGRSPNRLILSLAKPLSEGGRYELAIEGLMDSEGIPVGPLLSYQTARKAENIGFKELVINEVMAAPKSTNPLPYAEYVELFNASDQAIELGGYQLKNKSRTVLLPEGRIAPKSYLVLVDEDYAEAFKPYGEVLGLSKWPRYVNSADKVILTDVNDQPIDSVSYSKSSYGSSSAASSGVSLEVMNPYYKCDQTPLMAPSKAVLMGTPGKVNSIFDPTPDGIHPELVSATVLDSASIILEFSEAISPHLEVASWTVSPELPISKVDFYGGSLQHVRIVFGKEIPEGTFFEIEAGNLFDCGGNSLDRTHNKAVFQIPSTASKGEIILNEVLFNPVSGTPKFVEIYNHSSKYIDLNGWKLANRDDGVVDNRRTIAEGPLIISPFAYLLITTEISQLYQQYPKGKTENWIEISSLPSYPISEGTVILLNPDESLKDEFAYNEQMHHPLVTNPKGVSLERFSPEAPTDDPENWHSAAAASGYATPGYKNSQSLDLDEIGMGINVSPEIFLPEAAGEQPFTTVSYQLAEPGYTGTIRIFGTDGRLVSTLCQNEVWGIAGFYTWYGVSDSGSKLRPGYYVILAEIVHPKGQVKQFKKTVVVGSKLR